MDEKRFECGLCKSWLIFTKQRCTNPKCQHHEAEEEVSLLPEPLSQLTDAEMKLLFAFLLADGNLSHTAQMQETTKYHIKNRIKDLKSKIETLTRERDIIKNFIP